MLSPLLELQEAFLSKEEELGDESSPWLELAREDSLSKQELEDYSPWLELAKEMFLEKEKLGDDSPCLELRAVFLSKEGH